MENQGNRKRIRDRVEIAIILVLCAVTVVLDFIALTPFRSEFYNRMIGEILQQGIGSVAVILLMLRLRLKLFQKPQKLLYMIPCLIIAIDNFQFSAYFNGKMELVRNGPTDFITFAVYCLLVGLFEECIFRGVIFSVLAGYFSKDRKGFLLTYVISSLIFGGAHLFNVLGGAGIGPTLLQVGYTTLTGGLFAFALIKTKNILFAGFVHAVYNFCGLLFDVNGLGTGIVFDTGTVITMTIVSVVIGVFVLYSVWKYPENERKELYFRLSYQKTEENIGNIA